jgi:hypothetical protein
MNILVPTHQQHKNAKAIGILYLVIAIVGGFSIGYMPSEIIDLKNAEATFTNFNKQSTFFFIGVLGDIIVLILEVLLTTLLFELYKSTSKTLSSIAGISRLAMAIIMGINLINYLIPVFIYNQGTTSLINIDIATQKDISILFFYAHKIGEYCWQLFFSIHLFVLGILINKSNFVSKKIGLAMLIGSFGYFFQSLFFFLTIDNPTCATVINILLAIAVLGELSFTFSLLFKGIKLNTEKPHKC